MKKILISFALVVAAATVSLAQGTDKPELNSMGKPVVKSKDNAPVELKAGETIKRGDALASGVKKTTIEKVMKDPNKYADKTVAVSGVVVRSCKKEGCWMEMADKEGGKSVRVTFGDHKFFIPLNSAGLNVKAQGVFKTNILPKEKVDHLVKDDGAKFDKINADGTVTEVAFEATGVELTGVKK